MSAETVGSFKLRVQAPCDQPWGSMAGDDRSRHCTRCQLRVHNLSGMSKDDAFKLITGPEEHVCVRFNVRGDGSAVIGREGWVRRSLRVAGLVALAIGFWAAVALLQLPWRLARKPSPPPAAPTADADARARERQELEAKLSARALETRLAVIKEKLTMGRGVSMGGMPKHSRTAIRAEIEERRTKKHR